MGPRDRENNPPDLALRDPSHETYILCIGCHRTIGTLYKPRDVIEPVPLFFHCLTCRRRYRIVQGRDGLEITEVPHT